MDSSLQTLLKDADLSLLKYKTRSNQVSWNINEPQELEVLPDNFDDISEATTHEHEGTPLQRKSAEASFGSHGIGAVVIPSELRLCIQRLINESDKNLLHHDAKRLFLDDAENSRGWNAIYQTEYKSRRQAATHSDRDGTAFASIALPAHYSVIYTILQNLKHRLGTQWSVTDVMDWGSGTGSSLWAAMHSFQRHSPAEGTNAAEPSLSNTTLLSYLGIDRRDGLSAMSKRLLRDMDLGNASCSWQRGYTEANRIPRSRRGDSLAISAFLLSSFPTDISRRELVKQMWDSGAEVIVLIDHNSQAGFSAIAEAREYLLRMGRKETEDPTNEGRVDVGCHVVAPCPHDGACPIYFSGKSDLTCAFSQRLQRPAFIRKTKHARAGHEDIGYSYVVIRRSERSAPVIPSPTQQEPSTISEVAEESKTHAADADVSPSSSSPDDTSIKQPESAVTLEVVPDQTTERIRQDAHTWPRVVFPPLKRSGHIIIDGCTSEGKIMRLIYPRSQGKQIYYDARKSAWGDIFPHPPKNSPQVRFQATSRKLRSEAHKDTDDGRKLKGSGRSQAQSYEGIMSELKHIKKERRQEQKRQEKVSEDQYYMGAGSE